MNINLTLLSPATIEIIYMDLAQAFKDADSVDQNKIALGLIELEKSYFTLTGEDLYLKTDGDFFPTR